MGTDAGAIRALLDRQPKAAHDALAAGEPDEPAGPRQGRLAAQGQARAQEPGRRALRMAALDPHEVGRVGDEGGEPPTRSDPLP